MSDIPSKPETPDTSLAAQSEITTPDQDRKLVAQLAEAMGYKQQQEDIDQIKNMINLLSQQIKNINESLLKIVPVIDQHTTILNGQQHTVTQNTPNQTGATKENLQTIISGAKDLAEAWKIIKGGDSNSTPAIISQDYINEQVSNAVKKKFEIGDLIYEAIESTLTKGITKKIVNKTLETSHVPE